MSRTAFIFVFSKLKNYPGISFIAVPVALGTLEPQMFIRYIAQYCIGKQ